jgi:predicted CXXCH cytochrome family protein
LPAVSCSTAFRARAPAVRFGNVYAVSRSTQVCENPMLLRRSVNELCLECHLRDSDDATSHDLPVIDLSLDNSMGHPYERHPVSGSMDPVRGEEMSCISCHAPHGATLANLLKMGSQIPEDALNRNSETKDIGHICHLRL